MKRVEFKDSFEIAAKPREFEEIVPRSQMVKMIKVAPDLDLLVSYGNIASVNVKRINSTQSCPYHGIITVAQCTYFSLHENLIDPSATHNVTLSQWFLNANDKNSMGYSERYMFACVKDGAGYFIGNTFYKRYDGSVVRTEVNVYQLELVQGTVHDCLNAYASFIVAATSPHILKHCKAYDNLFNNVINLEKIFCWMNENPPQAKYNTIRFYDTELMNDMVDACLCMKKFRSTELISDLFNAEYTDAYYIPNRMKYDNNTEVVVELSNFTIHMVHYNDDPLKPKAAVHRIHFTDPKKYVEFINHIIDASASGIITYLGMQLPGKEYNTNAPTEAVTVENGNGFIDKIGFMYPNSKPYSPNTMAYSSVSDDIEIHYSYKFAGKEITAYAVYYGYKFNDRKDN